MIPKLLRFAFHLLYHQFAWTYDWVAALVSVGNWNRWVLSVLPEMEGREVLELGPGPGHLLKALQERGYRATGLEYSRQMVRRGRRLLANSGHPPNLCRGDARIQPFVKASFDTVVATFPAEYIADPQTWLEAGRVLRPGGRFVVLLGAGIEGNSTAHRAAKLLFRLTGHVDSEAAEEWEDRLHEFLADKPLRAEVRRKKLGQGTLMMVVAEKI